MVGGSRENSVLKDVHFVTGAIRASRLTAVTEWRTDSGQAGCRLVASA